MSKAVAIAATASAARRVQWVMIGMLMTLLAALSLSAWSQPAPSQPGMGAARHGRSAAWRSAWAACTAGASATAWAATTAWAACTTAWTAA